MEEVAPWSYGGSRIILGLEGFENMESGGFGAMKELELLWSYGGS